MCTYKLSRSELVELQNKRLRWLVKYVFERSPFYRRRFIENGIDPESIRTKEDLRRIPFTTKADLRDNYPLGLVSSDLSQIVRFHASSGTTGNPTVVAYTKQDVESWAELNARCLEIAGVTPKDVVQVSYGYGLFTGGLGLHYGAERLGAKVIPASTGNTKRQLKLMKDLGTTVICCTPSYGLFLAESARDEGLDPKRDLKLRVGVFGAEPWSENTRRRLEEQFVESAHDIYGMSELNGPGVAMECVMKDGLHVWEDHYIVEIIDPNTGEVLEPGEKGEMAVTTIMKEGMPLLRYRTRDITILDDEPCECGLTHARIKRILGRTDDMLKIRGICVFPSQVEEILMKTEGVSPHYQLIVDREGVMDRLMVRVEVSEDFKTDRLTDLVNLQQKLEEELKDTLSIHAVVELVEPKKLPRSEGKAQRIIDMRKI
ncbi:MAG: phenylacetate--CoA ligase [Candidatus Methanomethylicia archaeon]|jgi:phenylacetate-CoA ligase|nr:phenylacetate--CoA ligase [Candidatus Methanomethylicia archaeon]MCQ5373913.1 phenylacetate--CoA ligase [Candidatus Methanomethylicia archaeon]